MSAFRALVITRLFNWLDLGWVGTSQRSRWRRKQMTSAGDVPALRVMMTKFLKLPAVVARTSPCVG